MISKNKTGRQLLIQQFLADGISYMFGNPGTVEEGFLEALTDEPKMQYILALQETIAVFAADCYARATRKPALVQLHSMPGLGNAIGALYQAYRGHSPLVVIGGDAGLKYHGMDSQMAGDLVRLAEPVTKWSTMVMDSSSLLRVVRRAIKLACTPPMAPVFICLPMDILDAPCNEKVISSSIPYTRVAPDHNLIQQMTNLLLSAKTPVIYMGDGIAWSDAEDELVEIAELLGAPVWGCDSGELNMRYDHPLYQGQTGHMFGPSSRSIFQSGDVNLICGTYVAPEVFPELNSIFNANSKVIHIDLNSYEIAKNHPVTLGVMSDPKLTLHLLSQAIKKNRTTSQIKVAKTRTDDLSLNKQKQWQNEVKKDKAEQKAGGPIHFSKFMEELAPSLPDDVVIIDEALTNSPTLTRYLPPIKKRHFFQTRGGSLGIGIAGILGLKLAYPEKTVIAFVGDGGSMYAIQALWSAARYHLNVKIVICNNGCYQILKDNLNMYWQERKITNGQLPDFFDLSSPSLHFDKMAEGMGVSAIRVEKNEEISDAIRQMLQHPGPFLLDLCCPRS